MDQDGIKLTSYFDERRRTDGKPVGDALAELYHQRGVASSIILRGTEDLPLTAIAVDASPCIRAVLEETRRINSRGLITVERARFLSGDIEPLVISESDDEMTKLTVHFSRQDTVFQVPAFEAMCELLHRRNIGGATTLAGVDGSAHGRRQHAHFLNRSTDVPMVVVAVGAGKSIGPVLPDIGDLLRDPRMTLNQVRVCKRDGELINRPEAPSPYDDDGWPLWQKLTVFASAASQHDGQPMHRVLIRRLLSAGISGATTQPGIWGFRGDHVPHGGQHLLQLGHHVPAVTVVIDAPQRISTAFGIVDELTAEHGLVTCEDVAAIGPSGAG